jgi:hypothetical protein
MVIVQKIDWLSKESLEAKVTITDGFFKIICFSFPCYLKEGERIKNFLRPSFITEIKYSDKAAYSVKKNKDDYFAYYFIGGLADKKNGIIRIGNIYFDLSESVPENLNKGDFVFFNCGRVDI